MTHSLKTWPEPFSATIHGQKRFEFRKNDRDFKVGDKLSLHEWDPTKEKYTGRSVVRFVTYILHGPEFGIPTGHVVMSII
jgi:hypothetical protein